MGGNVLRKCFRELISYRKDQLLIFCNSRFILLLLLFITAVNNKMHSYAFFIFIQC